MAGKMASISTKIETKPGCKSNLKELLINTLMNNQAETIDCGKEQMRFREYGLSHFRTKYGLGDRFPMLFFLESPSEIDPCYANVSGETLPLFKMPAHTKGDTILGTVLCDGDEYPWLSLDGDKVIAGINIFEETGRVLAGYYDNFFLRNDEFGSRLRATPVVDALESTLFKALNNVSRGSLSRNTFKWPEGHKFALILTHDVDRVYKTYQYLPSIYHSIQQLNLKELTYHIKNLLFRHSINNPYWTFDSILQMEANLDVKSTFFFLNEKGRHNPLSLKSWILYRGVYDIEDAQVTKVIKKLCAAGHEIAVHGSYNSYNNLELLEAEKKLLESLTGDILTGVRQHYLNYDIGVTPTLQQKAGFKYDSSVGFKPVLGIGLRRGTSFPFQIPTEDMNIAPVLEIPLAIMDGGLDGAANTEDCFKLMGQVERYAGALTILWHTQRLNQREYPGMVDTYIKLIYEARARGAWIARADEVYGWVTKWMDAPTGEKTNVKSAANESG